MQHLYIPPDWQTAAYPHEQRVYRVGLFGRKALICCSCGITADNLRNNYQLHYAEEMRIRQWLETIRQRRSKRSGPYWE